MKRAQIIGIAIAGLCGVGAFVLSRNLVEKPKETKVEVQASTVKVLVAREDISLGTITADRDFRWQEYPESAPPPGAIICRGSTCSMREYAGGIARTPIMKEELITRSKLAKPGEGGVLAAILPAGKRAIAAKISEDSAVGKLILPNDAVDVILVIRKRGRGGQEDVVPETLFRNVRVLAIGQRIDVKDGQKAADGNTATLELTPQQAEQLARAKSAGELMLTLRPIADAQKSDAESEEASLSSKKPGSSVRMMRYGSKSRVYDVQ